MFFDLSGDLNPPVRFAFDEMNPDAGWVELRVLNGKARKDIITKTQKSKVVWKRGQRHVITENNDELFDRLMWDYCIADWLIYDKPGGSKIEPTPENKLSLMEGHPKFSAFVLSCIEKLNEDMLEIKEEEEKNSETSQTPSPTEKQAATRAKK